LPCRMPPASVAALALLTLAMTVLLVLTLTLVCRRGGKCCDVKQQFELRRRWGFGMLLLALCCGLSVVVLVTFNQCADDSVASGWYHFGNVCFVALIWC